jgi:hypothetical protein
MLPAITDQAAKAVAEHIKAIHGLVQRTRENIVEIGRHLAETRDQVDRGEWLALLEAEFGWSDQTAYRFIHVYELSRDAQFHTCVELDLPLRVLYQLAAPKAEAARKEIAGRLEAGEVVKADDVEKAIEGHKPPSAAAKGRTGTASSVSEKSGDATQRVTSHLEILAAWSTAPHEARVKAINSIGLNLLLAAVPADWWPLIEVHIAERHQVNGPIVKALPPGSMPGDLSIPEFLRCEPEAAVETIAGTEISEEHFDDPEEVEEDYEPKPKRKLKLIEYSTTLGEALNSAFADLQDLGSECREVVDNASEGLQQTQRIQTLETSADDLEQLEMPEVPDAFPKISVKYSLPKRRYMSRASRAGNDITMLEACVRTLEGIPNEDDGYVDAQTLIGELQSAIDTVVLCEFPGKYQ